MMVVLHVKLPLSSSMLLALPALAKASGPIVNIPNIGTVEGLDLASSGQPSLVEFRGIPYAQAPIGNLRWQPPKMRNGWAEVWDATAYGSLCPQTGVADSDEDCLFLNVLAPKQVILGGSSTEKLPVMIWIYGGGMQFGSGDGFPYDPNFVAMSNGTIVLVSLNYRLGVLGFLGGTEVLASTNGGGAGNFGIQDQRAAMAWVKANIGAFGGDSNQITIFGQSAGGLSTLHHLVQPASFPFYNQAILESGTLENAAHTMDEVEVFYKQLLDARGCTSLECLVAEDAQALVNVSATIKQGGIWLPTIDGVFLTNDPYVLVAAKNYSNKVPVIVGGNRDEEHMTVSIGLGTPHNLTEEEFDALAKEPGSYLNKRMASVVLDDDLSVDGLLDEMKRVYNPETYPYPEILGNYSSWYWMYVRFLSDNIPEKGGCGPRYFAQLLESGGSPAVYFYLFDHPVDFVGMEADGVFSTHGAELPFVFGWFPPDAQDSFELSKNMQRYWHSFATDGVPAGEVSWPKFTTEGDTVLVFDVEPQGGIRAEQGLDRNAACEWQAELAQARGQPGLNLGGPAATSSAFGCFDWSNLLLVAVSAAAALFIYQAGLSVNLYSTREAL